LCVGRWRTGVNGNAIVVSDVLERRSKKGVLKIKATQPR